MTSGAIKLKTATSDKCKFISRNRFYISYCTNAAKSITHVNLNMKVKGTLNYTENDCNLQNPTDCRRGNPVKPGPSSLLLTTIKCVSRTL